MVKLSDRIIILGSGVDIVFVMHAGGGVKGFFHIAGGFIEIVIGKISRKAFLPNCLVKIIQHRIAKPGMNDFMAQ